MTTDTPSHPDVATGTMTSFPCLGVAGAFVASCDHRTGDLVAGAGSPFAPAGRTFRERVLIDDRDATRWTALADEARRFVGGSRGTAARPIP